LQEKQAFEFYRLLTSMLLWAKRSDASWCSKRMTE